MYCAEMLLGLRPASWEGSAAEDSGCVSGQPHLPALVLSLPQHAGPDPSHHDPLVTYHLSSTSLTLQTATPQQAPGTHVVRLPLSGLAPLTSATYMPSDMKELSSKGYETYMVRTVEFLKVGGTRCCGPWAECEGLGHTMGWW
jgi:hypothetical protein